MSKEVVLSDFLFCFAAAHNCQQIHFTSIVFISAQKCNPHEFFALVSLDNVRLY
jgi:hypothetical protein